MHVDLHINEPFSVKTMFQTNAKSLGAGQPAHTAQADLGRNFLPFVNFLRINGLYCRTIYLFVKTGSRMC